MTGVFLQARINSQRLPRKVLLPVAGKPLLQHAMESLRMVSADVYAVLTDEDSRHELEPVCRAAGFQVFVGDPDDVLKRYIDAARHFEVSRILRATGDNPLVSFEIARASIRLAEEHNSDYAGYI
ncbi:MAG: cytidylyltransferase domain-containing protein, partial [Spirochaeta sp.]